MTKSENYKTCRKERPCFTQAELKEIRWPSVLEVDKAVSIFTLYLTEDGYKELFQNELWNNIFNHCLKGAIIEVWRAGRLWEKSHKS